MSMTTNHEIICCHAHSGLLIAMLPLSLKAHAGVCLICFDYLRTSQQIFSFVGTGLSGLNQY